MLRGKLPPIPLVDETLMTIASYTAGTMNHTAGPLRPCETKNKMNTVTGWGGGGVGEEGCQSFHACFGVCHSHQVLD